MAKKAAKNNQLIVQQLTIKAPARKVYDVGNWRSALKSADTGRVKTLYDLFDDIMLDGVLSDAVSKRIDAVLNSELSFQDKDGQSVEEIELLMDTPGWETLLSSIMNQRMCGRSAVEIDCSDGFDVHAIPAKHIDLRNKTILINDSDEKGIPYEGDNSLLVLGKSNDFGLLIKAVPYAIYKRGGFGDWSQWIELFGMPQRVGKYNTYDQESRRLLEQAMENAGSAPYLVIPKEAEIETKEGNSGSGSSYNEFRQACNEEMLITILGQTMTTVQGDKGARSLGEVHKEVEEGKNRSDLRFVQKVLNHYVLPMLEARGYPVSGGKFIFPKAAESLSVTDIIQLSDIMLIPQSYLHEKYAIPIPDDQEPIARRQTQDNPMLSPESEEEIKNMDRSFFMRMMDFFVKAPQDGASNGKTLIQLNDGATLSERLIARVANGETPYFDAELFRFISDDLSNAVKMALKQSIENVDYTYGVNDDAFLIAMEQNLFHFSAAKTLAEIQELNKAFRDSKSLDDFKDKASGICMAFNEKWQKTEYETALLTAESAANYQRLIKKKSLFPYWKYVTAGDDKVREEHQKLNGIILSCDDPRWNKIYPPNGWKCRCRVAPVMEHEVTPGFLLESQRIVDQYLGTSEWKKVEQQHWDSNRGKRSEIFNKNQMYIRKFPDMAAKMTDRISPAGWGAESSFKKLITSSNVQVPTYNGNANDWFDNHKTSVNGKEMMVIKDYKSRSWFMPKNDYLTHTTNKAKSREFRTAYLDCIPQIMADPDEVWLGSEYKDRDNKESKLNNYILIKYYNGKAVACVCKLEPQGMMFKSWFEVKDAKIRRGILIMKKK